MQIRIAHRFPVPAREYWDKTRDPALEARIAEAGDIEIHVLERRREGSKTHDRTRVSPRKELPAVAQRALGASRFSYVQIVDGDDERMGTTWEVVSDLIPDKVKCSGSSRVVDVPGGCERIIEGEIKVAIPLVGGAVEKMVLEQMEKSYERAAEVIRRHLGVG